MKNPTCGPNGHHKNIVKTYRSKENPPHGRDGYRCKACGTWYAHVPTATVTDRRRFAVLCPQGVPRWWRFYKFNGGNWETLMTGKNAGFGRECSEFPSDPQGVGCSFEPPPQYDTGGGGWPPKLGKSPHGRPEMIRVPWALLPPGVQRSVLCDEIERRKWTPGVVKIKDTPKGPILYLQD